MIAAITVLLALVLVAPHTEATCAWVLWSETVFTAHDAREGVIREWGLVAAQADRSACERAQAEALDLARQSQATRHVAGSTVFHTAHGLTTEYRFLPDTIDPRGPKGGGR